MRREQHGENPYLVGRGRRRAAEDTRRARRRSLAGGRSQRRPREARRRGPLGSPLAQWQLEGTGAALLPEIRQQIWALVSNSEVKQVAS